MVASIYVARQKTKRSRNSCKMHSGTASAKVVTQNGQLAVVHTTLFFFQEEAPEEKYATHRHIAEAARAAHAKHDFQ